MNHAPVISEIHVCQTPQPDEFDLLIAHVETISCMVPMTTLVHTAAVLLAKCKIHGEVMNQIPISAANPFLHFMRHTSCSMKLSHLVLKIIVCKRCSVYDEGILRSFPDRKMRFSMIGKYCVFPRSLNDMLRSAMCSS